MVAPVRKPESATVIGAPLRRAHPKPQLQPQKVEWGKWAVKWALNGGLLLICCLFHALIQVEAHRLNLQKQQLTVAERQVQHLQAAIACRLSALAQTPPKLPKSPALLKVQIPQPQPILLGRR